MREPQFWWRPAGTLASFLLAPVSAVYGAIAARRMAQSGGSVGIPVLCIGNLTLGGSGKTPAAIAVARKLAAAGQNPFLLTRGYGGRLRGPVRIDPECHRAIDVGDEALLLADVAPTVVATDRLAGAKLARSEGAGIIVMDDGFQNPSLAKTRSIVVVDGRRAIGNGKVFPAGPLRAPLATQLALADAVLIVGSCSAAAANLATRLCARGVPVFHGRLEPDQTAVEGLRGQSVLAFAGIGDPEKFFATLEGAGIDVRERRRYADHHVYLRPEAEDILASADRGGLVPVTTEKDRVRLQGDIAVAELAATARSLPVTLVIDEAAAFDELILAVR